MNASPTFKANAKTTDVAKPRMRACAQANRRRRHKCRMTLVKLGLVGERLAFGLTEILMKPLLLGIVLASLASGGQAADLDCTNVRTGIERMICADADLTVLDNLLMYTYDGEYTRLNALDESPQTANALERAQQEWLKTRRDSCPDSECLKEAYRSGWLQLTERRQPAFRTYPRG